MDLILAKVGGSHLYPENKSKSTTQMFWVRRVPEFHMIQIEFRDMRDSHMAYKYLWPLYLIRWECKISSFCIVMEGSGSGSSASSSSTCSYSSKSSSMAAPPASSISELFDGCASKSSGGHFGFGAESSRAAFTQQMPGVMARESNKSDQGTATRRHSEEYYVGSSLRDINGSNSQKGQSNHGKSRSLSDAFLASSLCYGGRDLYSDLSSAKPEGLHGSKEDIMDDETSTPKASRGNWWQGSLYY